VRKLATLIGCVIGFVFAHGDVATGLFGFALSMIAEARRSAVPVVTVNVALKEAPHRGARGSLRLRIAQTCIS
jgi:hypothetical protein